MEIGWIGLGKMGVPMSMQLLKAGHNLTVYNRTKEKERPLIDRGASRASSPKTLLKQTDVAFLMISDDEAVRHIFTEDEGILDGLDEDKIVVNTSTVSPDISKQMAQKCAAQNGHYIDAPVSGSVPQAEEQKLVSIVGGDESVVKKVKPLLQSYSKEVVHIGGVGYGNATKLAVNTFLGIIIAGLAETINFASQMNIEPEDFLSIIDSSAVGSPFIKMKGDAVLQDDYDAAFTLEHLAKDLRLAHKSGLDTSVGNKVYEIFQDAEPAFGREDVIAIIKYLRQI